jgi:hypothetical protein
MGRWGVARPARPHSGRGNRAVPTGGFPRNAGLVPADVASGALPAGRPAAPQSIGNPRAGGDLVAEVPRRRWTGSPVEHRPGGSSSDQGRGRRPTAPSARRGSAGTTRAACRERSIACRTPHTPESRHQPSEATEAERISPLRSRAIRPSEATEAERISPLRSRAIRPSEAMRWQSVSTRQTVPGDPPSVITGRPAPAQASIPPSTLTGS